MAIINIKKIFFFYIVVNAFLIASSALAQSNDAIAIRVMPNINHYSALQWYQANVTDDNQGSPAQLLVDGYEAIRDGRTVYVNAGNINNNALYTNIYIMSYTQNASNDTTDIFGQMLNNWTFNTNIIKDYGPGKCIQLRNNTVDPNGQLCYTDLDCGKNSELYCDSAKATVTRDVRRLADLRYINNALKSYAQNHDNINVQLLAGSYIKGKSLSVWPSWQDTLGKMLGMNLPVDPLNSLWDCRDTSRDPAGDGTCWNDADKSFNSNKSDIPDDLKNIGRVYSYSSLNDGQSYELCADNEALNIIYNSIFGDNANICF